MKESNTRNIKIIYRGSTSADRESRIKDQERRLLGDRLKEDGPSLEGRLDFRDEIVRIPLNFSVSKQVYMSCPSAYEEPMLDWLVGVVESILSMTFRQLLEERMSLSEGKAWACKNILCNIKALCEYLSGEVGVAVDEHFLQQLDGLLSEIISVVILKYPQTNAKSASRKVMKFIKAISDRDNDQYDFLYCRNLNIRYHTNADYSSQIMTVVNSLLNLPIEPVKEDESFMENFSKFCRQLFYYAHMHEEFGSIKDNTTFKVADESIDAILNNNVSPSIEQLDTLAHPRHGEAYRDLASALLSESYQPTEDFVAFMRNKGHLFQIGQKIPSQVRQFSEKEAREGQFKVYHAAVLRVLTKWSEELYQKLEKAGDLIRARIHKFKTNSEGLRFCSVEEKEFLYQEAVREKARVDDYLQALKEENKVLQSVFASEHVSGKFIRRFTNVDVFAGKLEEVVSHYTFRYLNRLVHSLLSLSIAAGERLYENYKYLQDQEDLAVRYLKELGEINLVTFKVGDLLRARYACEQHQFVNVLGLLYKMEELDPGYLRVVKIKNRMFEKDNDILINLFFRNRVICELQLSIHREENKKERLYSEFNHFIYELKRSQFGIIAEFASIVAQNDPIVNYFTFDQHNPPIIIENNKKLSLHHRSKSKELLFRRKFSDGAYLTHKLCEKAIQRPFLCVRCQSLKTVLNPKFYFRQENELFCNDCIEQELYRNPNYISSNTIFKELFKYFILDDNLDSFIGHVSLWNPKTELKGIRDEKQLYAAFIDFGFAIEKGDKVPRVRFFKTFYNSKQNTVVLSSVTNGEIDNFLLFEVKKLQNLEKYLFFSPKSFNQDDLLALKDYISQENCEMDYTKTVHLKEKEFLKKEYMRTVLKSFEKYHSTLYLNGYKYIVEYIYEYLHGTNEALITKRRSLFESNSRRITSLLLESAEIFTLYPFLAYFNNLRELNLSSNHITSIHMLQGFKQLQQLNISRNHIPSIEPLTQMPWLDTLIARGNQIASLTGIALIHSLRVLDCSENKLTSISDLEGLVNLEELVLNKNIIQNLQGIGRLTRLRQLSVNENNLSKIDHVFELTQLEMLELGCNYIDQMVPLPKLEHLNTFSLANNAIHCIIDMQTAQMKDLNLSENLIKKMENLSYMEELVVLNIAKNELEKIEGLDNLDKLRKLILNDNRISCIENLEQLKGLETLKIENNPISSISNINPLKTLSSLSFQHCELAEIAELNSLKKLKSLSLAHNGISCIKDIDELVRLQRLDLSFNNIQKIENLNTLKYLQNISLANNRITKMENLSQLVDLNWLVLSNNSIAAIEGLQGLTEMRVLELENNRIEAISGLGTLEELEELILSTNSIQKICGLQRLSNLKKLSLSNNKISQLQGVSELVRLQLLDLQMNCITRIDNLSSLGELKWLVLSFNSIERIENIQKLEQLSKLILSHNKITRIENISQLKVLSALYIDCNQLTKIENLDDLQNLDKLHLGHNQIATIEGLETLEQLSELNLENNQIKKIEGLHFQLKLKKLTLANNFIKVIENLENLKELIHLSVSNNQIEEVNAIHTLPYLQYIDFADNPISDPTGYSLLNENVKLCIQLIMQKFDSEALRRTNHNRLSADGKQQPQAQQQQQSKAVANQVKLIRSFAKSFRPQI